MMGTSLIEAETWKLDRRDGKPDGKSDGKPDARPDGEARQAPR